MPQNPLNPSDPYLNLQEATPEDLSEEVEKTNTELEKLRRQLETIEKQKIRLEELRKRQEELESGRIEMIDKLTRSLASIQREQEETLKRLEQLRAIHESFLQHLRYIESINPKLWSANELPKELSKGISAIEDARADYSSAIAKISALSSEFIEPAQDYQHDILSTERPQGFLHSLITGFAFTLPLQIIALAALMAWLLTRTPASP